MDVFFLNFPVKSGSVWSSGSSDCISASRPEHPFFFTLELSCEWGILLLWYRQIWRRPPLNCGQVVVNASHFFCAGGKPETMMKNTDLPLIPIQSLDWSTDAPLKRITDLSSLKYISLLQYPNGTCISSFRVYRYPHPLPRTQKCKISLSLF